MLLIDAHAHLHPCFDLSAALMRAHDNFARNAAELNLGRDWIGCLLCADLQQVGIETLAQSIERAGSAEMTVEPLTQSLCWTCRTRCESKSKAIGWTGRQTVRGNSRSTSGTC